MRSLNLFDISLRKALFPYFLVAILVKQIKYAIIKENLKNCMLIVSYKRFQIEAQKIVA